MKRPLSQSKKQQKREKKALAGDTAAAVREVALVPELTRAHVRSFCSIAPWRQLALDNNKSPKQKQTDRQKKETRIAIVQKTMKKTEFKDTEEWTLKVRNADNHSHSQTKNSPLLTPWSSICPLSWIAPREKRKYTKKPGSNLKGQGHNCRLRCVAKDNEKTKWHNWRCYPLVSQLTNRVTGRLYGKCAKLTNNRKEKMGAHSR